MARMVFSYSVKDLYLFVDMIGDFERAEKYNKIMEKLKNL